MSSSKKRKSNKTFISLKPEGNMVRVCIHKGALAPYPVPPDKGALMDPREKLPKADGLVFAKTTKGKKLWVDIPEKGLTSVFRGYEPMPLDKLELKKTAYSGRAMSVMGAVRRNKCLEQIAEAMATGNNIRRSKRQRLLREGVFVD